MTNRTLYLYALNTMADWEPGYVLAELNTGRYFKNEAHPFEVRVVAASMNPITTMGGLRVTPDLSVDQMSVRQGDVLLLPGADAWLDPAQQSILDAAAKALADGATVAAICGATMGLANTGLLDNVRHTSDAIEVLQQACPGYKGVSNYENEPVVRDDNLITAGGTAPLEFAREVLSAADVFAPETLDAWYRLNSTGEAQYFYSLMQSLPQEVE